MPNLTLNRVKSWIKQTPVVSRWPGTAVRKRNGDPDFIRGVVIAVSDLSVSVETERHTLVKLMGDGYPHICDSCQTTIPGHITYRRPPELRTFCPYCGPGHELRPMKIGEKVRVHHRFGTGNGIHSAIQTDTAWGQWYGERYEW